SPAQAAALRGARSTTDIPDTALESHWLYITTGRELPYGTVRSLQARDLVSSPRTVWVELPDEYVGLETFPLTDTGREVLAALQGEDAAEDPADDAEPGPEPETDQDDQAAAEDYSTGYSLTRDGVHRHYTAPDPARTRCGDWVREHVRADEYSHLPACAPCAELWRRGETWVAHQGEGAPE